MPAEEKQPKGRAKWLRILCFVLLFAVVFLPIQELLRFKYRPDDCGALRYQFYAEEPADSVDVVFISNSTFRTGICPMILYNEAGITSWNMSISYLQHTLCMEQLKTLLTLNTPPKFVVFSPNSLLHSRTSSREETEALYTQLIDDQPSFQRKYEIYHTVRETFGKDAVTPVSFLLPLLHHHSRWNQLDEVDWIPASYWPEHYESFLKGQSVDFDKYDVTLWVASEQWQDPNERFGDTITVLTEAAEGWTEFFTLCSQYDITPVALIQPRFDSIFQGEALECIVNWLDEQGVLTLNYMDETALADLNMDYKHHFSDQLHINFKGSIYFSQQLAYALSDELGLEDHRGEEGFESWDTDVTAFFDAYGSYITGELGGSYAPWWDMEDDLSF